MKQICAWVLFGAILASVEGLPQQLNTPPQRPQVTSGQTIGGSTGAIHTPNGPIVAVGTHAGNIVRTRGGVQASSAATQLQGGGGFTFGTNGVVSTAEREGALPVQTSSRSTVLSTGQTALGSSQASTLSTLPSTQPGVPSRVLANAADVSVLAVRGGITDHHRHVGTIEAGPNGATANIGGVVEQQLVRAGRQSNRLQLSTDQLRRRAAGFTRQAARTVDITQSVVPAGGQRPGSTLG